MLIIEEATTTYPLDEVDVRRRFPHVSFPADFHAEHLPEGYAEVLPTARPQRNRWQSVAEAPPVLIEGVWFQQWQLTDLPVTLEGKREQVKLDADLTAKRKRDQVVSHISAGEMASWPIKRAEALAFDGTGATAPNLDIEATARGITLAALVEKVLAKAQLFSGLEAAIAGRCGALQDQANTADEAGLLAILSDMENGWPV